MAEKMRMPESKEAEAEARIVNFILEEKRTRRGTNKNPETGRADLPSESHNKALAIVERIRTENPEDYRALQAAADNWEEIVAIEHKWEKEGEEDGIQIGDEDQDPSMKRFRELIKKPGEKARRGTELVLEKYHLD